MSKRGRVYECNKCGRRGERFHMVRHVVKSYLKPEDAPFYCSLCGYKGLNEMEMVNHKKSFRKHIWAVKTGRNDSDCIKIGSGRRVKDGEEIAKLGKEESEEFWGGRPTREFKETAAEDGKDVKEQSTEKRAERVEEVVTEERGLQDDVCMLERELDIMADDSELEEFFRPKECKCEQVLTKMEEIKGMLKTVMSGMRKIEERMDTMEMTVQKKKTREEGTQMGRGYKNKENILLPLRKITF